MTGALGHRGWARGLAEVLNPRDGMIRKAVRAVRTRWKIPLAILLRRRTRFDAIVGVTGSAGKSTTSRLIAAALGADHVVHLGSGLNTTDGIRKTFVRRPRKAGLWVQEISGHDGGAMKSSLAFVRPTIGVVTTIGMDHISHFKTLDAIACAKAQLVESLPHDGFAILNADDPLVAAMASRTKAKVVTFGRHPDADIRLVSCSSRHPERLSLRVQVGDAQIDMRTRFLGERWATSVLAAVATAHVLGLDQKHVAELIGAVEPDAFKDGVHVHGGVTFIVDSCKAPDWTIPSSIEILAAADAPRKIMLIGTISDYRGNARAKYVNAAKSALAAAQIVIFYGPQAERIRRLTSDHQSRLFIFDEFDSLMAFLKDTLTENDLIYIKSSRADHLERVMLDHANPVSCRATSCGRQYGCRHCKHLHGKPRPAAGSRQRMMTKLRSLDPGGGVSSGGTARRAEDGASRPVALPGDRS
ncbi:hypothetical protein EJC49_21110 [Aquibium carbonis]|uniref:Mur ligase central domain-containing protein n=1 Tax=Aquibium carbonis TaxID=2495581 RepID=A0A3R9ZXY1_9HYPH|nr:Mur ligase family protein [Aquibium carbonis]RST84434.1 hypothetical protein EJC49_21110 [Aquibium carbonis]